jgi:hypothetical protein
MVNKLDLVADFCGRFEDIDYTGSIMLEDGYFVNYLKCFNCLRTFEEFGHHEFQESDIPRIYKKLRKCFT